MKRVIFITISLFGFGSSYSQSLTPEVSATSGDYYIGVDATLSWTIGESVVETFSGTNAVLTQGFQQPLYLVTSVEEAPDNPYQISVYPNPTTDLINISVQSVDQASFNVELINLQGKRLYHQNIDSNNNTIDLKQYATGIYMLKIYTSDNKFLKSYRISKL